MPRLFCFAPKLHLEKSGSIDNKFQEIKAESGEGPKDCKMAGDMRGRGYSMPTRTNILEVETTRTTMAPPVAQLSRTESSWQTELL